MRIAHIIILLFAIVLLCTCKAESIQNRTEINIQLIRNRCDRLAGSDEETGCLKDYAQALSKALSEYIDVEVYKADQWKRNQ